MTNNANHVIPAKRYFSLDEMCKLVQISPSQFAQWQHENGIVVGYGGGRGTPVPVGQRRGGKDTFAPYVDRFSRDSLDVNGHPAAKAEEVRDSLNQILADLEAHS